MTRLELPERPSLDYLKRRAKQWLAELRAVDPAAKLAAAQLAIARDHGFASWRALKAEVDRRRAPTLAAWFEACRRGDAVALDELLRRDPLVVRERAPGGETGLHLAAHHAAAICVLLAHGADPDVRDTADHATPLHRARGVDAVRALLDAGADPHGEGDAHQLDVIGWHTCFEPTFDPEVVALLLARGARHHVFSAIATGDRAAIEELVAESPDALARRLSHREAGQTALHYVIAPPDGLIGGGFRTGAHHATLDLLIELGADLEAEDDRGRTPLEVAMLHGDRIAMERLRAAGARVPPAPGDAGTRIAELAASATRMDVMLRVLDLRATIDWYRSIGFALVGHHALDSDAAWAGLAMGGCRLMLVPGGSPTAARATSLWIRTERVEDLYHLLRQRQLDRASALLAGSPPAIPEARFQQDLHDTFYGEREFTIVDPDGYEITFCRSLRR
ncbi:MAG TPA: ankyrin repeat domain-containing protein [Kofleriaceae bacterium]|jgi:ankyrin repeat protein|nr:ankyrin repeat domain-containing protein [Kofleriaceae bacterium]